MEDYYYYYDETNNAYEEEYGGLAGDLVGGGDGGNAQEAALRAVFDSDSVRAIDPSLPLDLLRYQAGKITSVFNVSRQFALLLMRRHHFNPDTASERYVMAPEESHEHLGVSSEVARAPDNRFVDAETAKATSSGDGDGTEPPSCELCCFEDGEDPDNRLYALSNCGHYFCHDCWCDAVRVRVRHNTSILKQHCLHAGCEELVDTWALMDLVGDAPLGSAGEAPATAAAGAARTTPDTIGAPAEPGAGAAVGVTLGQRMRRSVLSEYIDGNARLNWCANPQGCDRILFCPLTGSSTPVLTCPDCGFPFCGRCGAAAHVPATCAATQEWHAMLEADGASIAHILKATKACPKCGSRIEKNMGCNHMHCRCQHDFCWICMGDWDAHGRDGAYNCTAKAASVSQRDETDAEKRNRIFYGFFQGYDAHLSSLRADTRSLEAIHSKIPLICQRQLDLFDNPLHVGQIASVLTDMERAMRLARLTLAATYIDAYHTVLKSGKEDMVDNMLLHRRGVLMVATEDLSRSLVSLLNPTAARLSVAEVAEKAAHTKKLVDIFNE